MVDVYYIGGSSFSGKSTVAEILIEKYNLYYFKVDESFKEYIQKGKDIGLEFCSKFAEMSFEESQLRSPEIQFADKINLYKEIFCFILDDLSQMKCRGIITESTAYLPELMHCFDIPYDRFVSLTPTEEFRIANYKKRNYSFPFPGVCSDMEKVFSNWLQYDILLTQEIQKQCINFNYLSFENDGSMSIYKLAELIADHFHINW